MKAISGSSTLNMLNLIWVRPGWIKETVAPCWRYSTCSVPSVVVYMLFDPQWKPNLYSPLWYFSLAHSPDQRRSQLPAWRDIAWCMWEKIFFVTPVNQPLKKEMPRSLDGPSADSWIPDAFLEQDTAQGCCAMLCSLISLQGRRLEENFQ